eukprot:Hpha_TRINITY_DN13332_c0_g1::TRINITY_DN13332_c0_g1_i1::g.95325::m.95325
MQSQMQGEDSPMNSPGSLECSPTGEEASPDAMLSPVSPKSDDSGELRDHIEAGRLLGESGLVLREEEIENGAIVDVDPRSETREETGLGWQSGQTWIFEQETPAAPSPLVGEAALGGGVREALLLNEAPAEQRLVQTAPPRVTSEAQSPSLSSRRGRGRNPEQTMLIWTRGRQPNRFPSSAPSSEGAPGRFPAKWRFVPRPPPPTYTYRKRPSLPEAQGYESSIVAGVIADAGVGDLYGWQEPPQPPPPIGAVACLVELEAQQQQQQQTISPAHPPLLLSHSRPPPPQTAAYSHHLHPGRLGHAILNNSVTRPLARVVGFAPSRLPVKDTPVVRNEDSVHPALPPTVVDSLSYSEMPIARTASDTQEGEFFPASPSSQPQQAPGSLAASSAGRSPRLGELSRESSHSHAPVPSLGRENSAPAVPEDSRRSVAQETPRPSPQFPVLPSLPAPTAPPPWWCPTKKGDKRRPPRRTEEKSPYARAVKAAAGRSGARGERTKVTRQASVATALVLLVSAARSQRNRDQTLTEQDRPHKVRFHVPKGRASPHSASTTRTAKDQPGDDTRVPRPPAVEPRRGQPSRHQPESGSPPRTHEDEDPLSRQMTAIFHDLQDTWRVLSKDSDSSLRDLDRSEVLLSLKKDFLKRHPLPHTRLADALPRELQHCATTVVGTDGVQRIVTVRNKDTELVVPEAEKTGRRRRDRRGVRRDRKRSSEPPVERYTQRWYIPCEKWGVPTQEPKKQEVQVSLKQLLAEHSAASRDIGMMPALNTQSDVTELEVNVLGGLVPLSAVESERVQGLLDAQNEAVKYMQSKGHFRQ